MQGDKFSAQVAALESEVKSLKADNASLSKDNKACYSQIRAKDKELDAAAKQVAQARQTDIQNKVGPGLHASPSRQKFRTGLVLVCMHGPADRNSGQGWS